MLGINNMAYKGHRTHHRTMKLQKFQGIIYPEINVKPLLFRPRDPPATAIIQFHKFVRLNLLKTVQYLFNTSD